MITVMVAVMVAIATAAAAATTGTTTERWPIGSPWLEGDQRHALVALGLQQSAQALDRALRPLTKPPAGEGLRMSYTLIKGSFHIHYPANPLSGTEPTETR